MGPNYDSKNCSACKFVILAKKSLLSYISLTRENEDG
jgi:hypothetical protein